MIEKKLFLSLILLFFVATVFSQITEEEAAALDEIFSAYNRSDRPGCAVAIVHDGKIIFEKGYGMADLEHGIAIAPTSVFYSGSISKQFVAASALLLSEQGLLNLESEVQTYLPQFRRYSHPITIQHLIYHTSGIRDYFEILEENGLNYLNQIRPERVFSLINEQPNLDFTPGEEYSYSNSGYLLLAMIIEKVSGQSLPRFVDQEIFEPLEMEHSLFLDDVSTLVQNRAFGYQIDIDGNVKNMLMRFDLVGSGGLYTTVQDLAKWDRNFYHPKMGSPNFISKLLTTGELLNGQDTRYAFALRKDTFKGLPVIGHSGSLGGYRAQYIQFPDQKFSIIILSNVANCKPGELAHEVAQLFLKKDFRK